LNKNLLNIGILSAMPEEVGFALDNLENIKERQYGDLKIYNGNLKNEDFGKSLNVYLAWSGWGKVSSARATIRVIAAIMEITKQKPDLMFFSGVAGAINRDLRKWDVVIADSVVQHDMDATPIYPRFVIPAINDMRIHADHNITKKVLNFLLDEKIKNRLNDFGQVRKGLIASGDMFISSKQKINQLRGDFHELMCVEMEGASFAQVCFQEQIKWMIIRVISDNADDSASDEFEEFLKIYNSKSWELIKKILSRTKYFL
tara:strand:+ start:25662 stop:26438 length:777 start_codon:yes stop_codon:yes gene_type:complete